MASEKLTKKGKYIINKFDEPNIMYEILKALYGARIHSEFKEYIIKEIEIMNAMTITLSEGDISKTQNYDKILGHMWVYIAENRLYFSFYKIPTLDDTSKIVNEKTEDGKEINKINNEIFSNEEINQLMDLMVDTLKEYANENKCKEIRGPINHPPIIFGTGFTEEGSELSLFAGATNTSPEYIKLFEERGFSNWHRIFLLRVMFRPIKFQPEFEIKVMDNEPPGKWLNDMLELQIKYFPESAQLTPKRDQASDYYFKFLKQFGRNNMINCVFDGEKMIATGWTVPNVYDVDEEGECRSVILMGGAVHPDYRGRGVFKDLFRFVINNLYENGFKYGEYIVGDDNKASIHAAELFGGKIVRKQVIMHLKI
ncbi:MAG: GNAT family N-acetyltransferase [Promethearchaeota archaeon]